MLCAVVLWTRLVYPHWEELSETRTLNYSPLKSSLRLDKTRESATNLHKFGRIYISKVAIFRFDGKATGKFTNLNLIMAPAYVSEPYHQ